MDPKDYHKIPEELRGKDNFKGIALAAVEADKWNITEIPEKFVTKEMVSSALSYDMELADRVPIRFLTEDMLVEKIKNSNNQGVFKAINDSGEHPDCIEYEKKCHKTALRYIPKELRTDKVCQAAITVNPKNVEFVSDDYKKRHDNSVNNIDARKQDMKETVGTHIKDDTVNKKRGIKM